MFFSPRSFITSRPLCASPYPAFFEVHHLRLILVFLHAFCPDSTRSVIFTVGEEAQRSGVRCAAVGPPCENLKKASKSQVNRFCREDDQKRTLCFRTLGQI